MKKLNNFVGMQQTYFLASRAIHFGVKRLRIPSVYASQ